MTDTPTLETVVTTAQAYLDKAIVEERYDGGVAYGTAFYTDDGSKYGGVYYACHKWVSNSSVMAYPDYKAKRDLIIATVIHPRGNADHRKQFVEWICCEDNPLSKYILNRDNPQNGLLIHVNKDGKGIQYNQVMWLCKAVRIFAECPVVATVWSGLVERGVHPLLAFFYASWLASPAGAKDTYTYLSFHHPCVFYYMVCDKKELVNLLTYTLNTKKRYNTSEVWLESGESDLKGSVKSLPTTLVLPLCSANKKSDGWSGYIITPGAHLDDVAKAALALTDELMGTVKVVEPVLPDKDTVFSEIDL